MRAFAANRRKYFRAALLLVITDDPLQLDDGLGGVGETSVRDAGFFDGDANESVNQFIGDFVESSFYGECHLDHNGLLAGCRWTRAITTLATRQEEI